ncbi:MAG: caspase family protein [Pseudomonadota bacterium]
MAILAACCGGTAMASRDPAPAEKAITSTQSGIRGLVIGIDKYPKVSNGDLDGAANDAWDLASALRQAGAKEVRLLMDRDATRQAVLEGWRELIKSGQPDDLLVFSFAGHGSQEPERVKGSEADGLDETLLLSGYSPTPPGNVERLIDDEIGELLQEAVKARRRVLFIADACHSGTMTRGFDTRVRPFKVRALPTQTIVDDHLPPPNPQAAILEPENLEGVTSFGAVQDNELAPESIINGQSRGALSWAMARALRGEADLNHDGQITDGELATFVREAVRTKMEGQQHPSVSKTRAIPLISSTLSSVSLADTWLHITTTALDLCKAHHWLDRCDDMSKNTPLAGTPAPPANPVAGGQPTKIGPVEGMTSPDSLALAILNTPQPEQALTRLKRAYLATKDQAVLTWDVERAEILSRLGEIVGYANEKAYGNPVSPTLSRALEGTRGFERSDAVKKPQVIVGSLDDTPQVQQVIDKWRLVERLKARAEAAPLVMSLAPDDKIHAAKSEVKLSIQGFRYPYFTLFNLGSDGTVNFLYPLHGEGVDDVPTVPLDRPYLLPLRVTSPFGADHFIALATPGPLTALHQLLAKLNGWAAADELLAGLSVPLEVKELQLGVQGVYTKP